MEKHLTRSFFLTFFLYNNFLRIGDDDIKVGIINCMENCPCLIQKMELDIGIKNTAYAGGTTFVLSKVRIPRRD